MEHSALNIQTGAVQRSERVKSLDVHPTEPWILSSLHTGTVSIWNYQYETTKKLFKNNDSPSGPVRSAKFVPSKHWIVIGSDDGYIRVYDYTTFEKIKEFKAHEDYIRCILVHPTRHCILTASDDKSVKLWDWEEDWSCCMTFEGHSHYVMHLAFNPNDNDSFASASLDGTVKIWSIDSPVPKFTIDAHSKGVNCVEFYLSKADSKLFLVSGSDDFTAKVWDYESKNCVCTLEGHEHNVTSIFIHPEHPVVITGSEDKTVRVWSKATQSLEAKMDFNLGRIWAIRYIEASEQVVFACDEGTIITKIVNQGI